MSDDIYIILSGDGVVFEGTVAQADNAFGLKIAATEADLISFVRTSSCMPSLRLLKLVASHTDKTT